MKLLRPVKIKSIILPNRITVGSMCQYSAENGNPSLWHYGHLQRLAQSGAGMLMLESTAVSMEGRISLKDLTLIDKKLEIPVNCNLLKSANKHETIIFFNKYRKKKITRLKKMKVKLIRLPLDEKDNFDVKNIVKIVKKLGYSRMLLECGINLTKVFLKERLVNDFYLFISKNRINKEGFKSFKDIIKFFLEKKKFSYERVHLLGDKLILFKVK